MPVIVQISPNGKEAILAPPIKSSLDHERLRTYTHMSNLSFIFKTMEKVISKRVHAYLKDTSLFFKVQFAHRTNHSTETALIHIWYRSIYRSQIVVLKLLRLKRGVLSIQDNLFESVNYVFRFKASIIKVIWVLSSILECGVLQDSVERPPLHTLRTQSLGELISRSSIKHYIMYANDTQLLCPVSSHEKIELTENAGGCLTAI